jgi:molybdate transport system regulatory protein
MARKQPELKLRIRLMLGDEIALGPGKADLLEGISETGSIAAAGRRLGMSYKRAWQLVETMNRCFRNPLVVAAKGGKGGGGASITDEGRRVLGLYRRMQMQATTATRKELAALRRALVDVSSKP